MDLLKFKKNPVFVFVHGAFHGGWCWKKVSRLLQEKGVIVYTPTLTGLGDRKDLLDGKIDLYTHIRDVVNLIVMEDLTHVILVGHSYGGAVITGVADLIPERITKLVFLDAMLVRHGQSLFDVSPAASRQRFMESSIAHDNGLSIPFPPAEVFGITDPDDKEWVGARLTNQPTRTFSQTLVLKNEFGNRLPITYIACKKPEFPPIKPFSDQAKNILDWTYLEIPAGHDAMITRPQRLAVILKAIKCGR